MKLLIAIAAVMAVSGAGLAVWYAISLPVVTRNEAPEVPVPPKAREALPDVIIVSVDALRADAIGASGNERVSTPRIDELARRGVYFTEATTPFPRTTPALASMLTGLRPANHGSTEVFDDMKRGRTMAEELRDMGYATAAVSANAAASANQNLDRGFGTFYLDRGAQAEELTDLTLDVVAEVTDGRPLFLWVHYLDPHFIYKPPSDWRPEQDDDRCMDMMWSVSLGTMERAEVYSNKDNVAREALASCREYYWSEVEYADHHVGRLLDGLGEMGRLDNAVTVFTADHGENLGEQDLYYEHGPSPHDASVRIPLILVKDGWEPGTDDGVAALEDLAPTIYDVLDIGREKRPRTDGVSLFDRLQDPEARNGEAGGRIAYIHGGRPLHSTMYRYPVSGCEEGTRCVNGPRYSACEEEGEPAHLYLRKADPERERDLAGQKPEKLEEILEAGENVRWDSQFPIGVRTPSFKLVAYPTLSGTRRQELYDLATDASERVDVSGRFPEKFEALSGKLHDWFDRGEAQGPRQLTEDELIQMRALGYIE